MKKSLDEIAAIQSSEQTIIDAINTDKRKTYKGFAKDAATASVLKITDSVSPEATDSEPETAVDHKVADTTASNTVSLDSETLKNLVETAVKNAVVPFQSELEAAKDKLQTVEQQLTEKSTELDQTKAKLSATEKDAATLKDLSNLFGKPVTTPNVNRFTTTSSDQPSGILTDCFELLKTKAVKTNNQGALREVHDFISLDKFVRANKDQVLKDLEEYGKKNGLFQGTRVKVTDAVTTAANIDGGFLSVLSSLMRSNNRPGFIFHQFPVTKFEFDKGEGDNIKVPRAAYQTAGTSSNDWLLSGNGSYFNVDPSSQSISTGTVNITLKEYGLGKNPNYPPIGIPSFVSAYSMIDLMMILNRNLLYNYYQFEDVTIRELWDKTSAVVYNDKGSVTATVGDVTSGDGGTLTDGFLTNLRAYMQTQLFLPLADGCYGLAAHPTAVAQLKESLKLSYSYSPVTEAQLVELSNILNPTLIGPGEVDRITGYVGKYEGFHIFESNNMSVGAPGSVGVQTETIGGASNTTRTSYAFGADTIGRGVGTAMEIRKDDITNFQRLDRFIWLSHEGFDALDVDPTGYNDTSAVPQQLRVLDVRTVDKAV